MKYDVAVIGGGPAGMIAAGRAGEIGAHTVLLEKNKNLGIKLLITGKGRCNITNKNDDIRNLLNNYGKNGKFLYSSIYNFGVDDIIEFFKKRGLEIKVERGNRVFPQSDKSNDVLNILKKYLKKSKVDVKTECEVKEITKEKGEIKKVILADGEEVLADKYIFCTGGKSFPGTGSTGEVFLILKKIGHKINKLKPSLTPVVVKEEFIKKLEGLSLKNVSISIFHDNKKINSRFGEAIFTNNGMSGPIILDLSKSIGEVLPGNVKLKIDFKPALDYKDLDERIQKDFRKNNNRIFKNSLKELLPKKLIPIIIELSGIDEEKKVNLLTKEERKRILHLLKEFELNIIRLEGFSRAIITSGGVNLSEVDPKTMQSRLYSNLYFAGEILDLDGPTGGYNLQICWSTGYAAGEGSVNNKN